MPPLSTEYSLFPFPRLKAAFIRAPGVGCSSTAAIILQTESVGEVGEAGGKDNTQTQSALEQERNQMRGEKRKRKWRYQATEEGM